LVILLLDGARLILALVVKTSRCESISFTSIEKNLDEDSEPAGPGGTSFGAINTRWFIFWIMLTSSTE
jgi:hypothetical protein